MNIQSGIRTPGLARQRFHLVELYSLGQIITALGALVADANRFRSQVGIADNYPMGLILSAVIDIANMMPHRSSAAFLAVRSALILRSLALD